MESKNLEKSIKVHLENHHTKLLKIESNIEKLVKIRMNLYCIDQTRFDAFLKSQHDLGYTNDDIIIENAYEDSTTFKVLNIHSRISINIKYHFISLEKQSKDTVLQFKKSVEVIISYYKLINKRLLEFKNASEFINNESKENTLLIQNDFKLLLADDSTKDYLRYILATKLLKESLKTLELTLKQPKDCIRVCSHCNRKIVEGYVINGGENYYCNDECLKATYTEVEISDLEIGTDDSDSYWTTWYD